jgi:tetratricopeptide (TPR) repeat protein
VEIARWAEFEETADWCLRVGFTLADNSEFDEAIKFLQKSLRGGKGDGIALCTMADCYAKANDLEKAIETTKLGISFLSDNQAYMTDWAYYYLTQFYFELGQIDGFLESGSSLLDQIKTCGPGNALPNYLAWYLASLLEVKQNKHAIEVTSMIELQMREFVS